MNGTLRNQVEMSKVKTESRVYLLFATKGFSSRATRETKGMIQRRVKLCGERLVVLCPSDDSHTVGCGQAVPGGHPGALGLEGNHRRR